MLRRELAAVAVGDQLAFGDAQQRVVGFIILAGGEERLVGGDERNAAAIAELDQGRLDRALARHAVALQFDIKAIAEPALQFFAARQRQGVLAGRNGNVERAIGPAGERDQSVGRVVEPGKFYVRALVRRGLEISARRQPHQAAIAVFARGQEHDTRPGVARGRPAVFLVAEIDAKRAADDRLDAGARHLLGKFQRTEHVVGVGQRQRRLAILFGKFRQASDGQRALEQRIGRMDVQMHEAGILPPGFLPPEFSPPTFFAAIGTATSSLRT